MGRPVGSTRLATVTTGARNATSSMRRSATPARVARTRTSSAASIPASPGKRRRDPRQLHLVRLRRPFGIGADVLQVGGQAHIERGAVAGSALPDVSRGHHQAVD